jgi:hypothetical protein
MMEVPEITEKLKNSTINDDDDSDSMCWFTCHCLTILGPDPTLFKKGGSLFINSNEEAQVIEDGKAVGDPLKSSSSFKDLNLYVYELRDLY